MFSKFKRLYLFGFSVLMMTFSLSAVANEAAWVALQKGEAVAVLRHAIAPDTNETSFFEPERCENERNLSKEGRDQATKIGETFRKNGISKAAVYSSSFCRCIDTGKLFNYGAVSNLPEINSYFADRSKGPAQLKALQTWIKKAIAEKSGPNILVTHGLNTSDLTSGFAEQGDVMIVGIEDGKLVTMLQFSTQP